MNKPELPAAIASMLTSEGRPSPGEDAPATHPPNGALHEELTQLEATLRSKGLQQEAEEVGELKEHAHPLWTMGGRVGDVAAGIRGLAARQWQLFNRELAESREAFELLRRRIRGDIRSFSPEEEEHLRGQLADVFRMVPATALALAPVPGIALLAPFVLKKLNLLPSAWREAHLVHRLETTKTALEAKGQHDEAQAVEAMLQSMRERQADREDRLRTLRKHPAIRILYDFNMDGFIDDDEWAVVKEDRQRLVAAVTEALDGDGWYFTTDGLVEGPLTLRQLLDLPLPEHALIHGPLLPRWVPVELLYEAAVGDDEEEEGSAAG